MIHQFLKNEKKVKDLISGLRTVNADKLLEYLEKIGYFVSPASARFHGAYRGGLVYHSLEVYRFFSQVCTTYDLNVSMDDIIICSLLHDVCKCGAYIHGKGSFIWNKNHPKGHGKLSVSMLEKVIPVSLVQKEIILYHMGIYGAVYDGSYINEYSVSELINVFNRNPLTKLFYFCDEMATFKEKLEENWKNHQGAGD